MDLSARLESSGAADLSTVEAAIDPDDFVAAKISTVMVYSPWVWPAAEAVHFLGLCLSFGVLLAVNLRILGVMRQVAFADVHRLLPWGMLGFGANLITGMMFFVGYAWARHTLSHPWIVGLVFLGVGLALVMAAIALGG